ncbi:MAG: hotdog fold domain-containing protein [Woeseia sp.]
MADADPSPALSAWRKLSGTAAGRWLFSRVVCFRAPYFASIHPVIETLEPGHAIASIKKRRSVTNHIGTVHAIAMANLCELVAGTLTEISIPRSMRWIPRGMQISYLAKAATGVTATGTFPAVQEEVAQDVVVPVDVVDQGGTRVVHADITMYLTLRKPDS